MSAPLYLNLGAGSIKLPGFLNIDICPEADMQLDLTKKLPWPDRSVAGIYSEHFIEHLSQAEGIQLLHECRRVLQPGGIFRIATPDLVEVIQDYVDDFNNPVWEKYGYYWTQNRCERLNLAMREWGHKWLFDEEELVRLGTMVGFDVRARCELGKSHHSMFRNLETRDSSHLIIEFQKPLRTLEDNPEPLVSIVIPSYNPRYFSKALDSAIAQTYRNLEIVICDDCRTDEIRNIAQGYIDRDTRIRYRHNPEQLRRANMMRCFDEARGEFVKYLNDDDELAPNCVERMLTCFAQYQDISLVTSRRQRIDENGANLPDTYDTLPPVQGSAILDGVSLGSSLLALAVNFVGEPTTAMFRKRDLEGIKPDFMSMDGRPILAINDVAMWLHLAMKGNTVYLDEALSRFRIHPQQCQNTMRDELLKAFPGDLQILRRAWERFGFCSNLAEVTLKFLPLASTQTDWQQRSLLPAQAPAFSQSSYTAWLDAARLARGRPLLDSSEQAVRKLHFRILVATSSNHLNPEGTIASIEAQSRPADKVWIVSPETPLPPQADASPDSWTLLLNAGDQLEREALLLLEQAITRQAGYTCRLVYFDHDELDPKGTPQAPQFKPAFNYDLMLSYPYMGRALAVRTDWAQKHIEGARISLSLASNLALQAYREVGAAGFLHLPSVLAHLSPAEPCVYATSSESWQELASLLSTHLEARVPGAQLIEGPVAGTFHCIYPLPCTPLVSIVIPTRDQLPFLSRCIESLLEKTNYPNFEILIVDNDSQTTEAQAFLSGLEQVDPNRIRVLRVPGPFNFSRMNNIAVAQARGEFILLLNNDTAVLHADWLSHMMRHALRDGVGVVGARLVYPEGTVQHAGVIMGLRGPADHPCLGMKPDEPGYMFRAQLTQNFSAVTAACMLVSKAVYEEVGGLDEEDFAVSYNDVDFCLKVGQTGRRIVWTPLATLLHEGSASQKASIENLSQANKSARFSKEQAAMYRKWPEVIANDPAYNPNLSLVERGYEVETNPLLCYDPLREFYEHKVVAFAADPYGCGNYRILQPMQAMLDDDLCIGGSSPEIFGPNLALRSRADVLVFQRPTSDAGIQTLESLIPLKGVKKVFEVDDNLTRVPYQSVHHKQMPTDIRKRMIKSIGLCDRLIVSTQPLAEEFKHANDDVRVVLNRLPPAMWGESPPVTALRDSSLKRKPVVAWAGGVGHGGDLALVAQVVKELADVVDWEFFGMCPDSIRPYVKRVHTGVPTLEYPAKLMQLAQNWDLAIAPLEVNAFNESKSNLRLLEYGWCGLPVVCSDVTPYQDPGFPVTRVKNRYKDWKAAILERVNDLESTRQQGLALQAVVQRDWMLQGEHVVNWYKAWTD